MEVASANLSVYQNISFPKLTDAFDQVHIIF